MKRPRILIVDDEADMRWVMRGVFEDEAVDVQEAANGQEAIALLDSFAPDVVLTDIVMPEVDGRVLLQHCRTRDQDLPVILISAIEDIDVAVRAIKDGAFDYMAKPFDSERLLVTTSRAIEQRRLRQEVAALKGQLRSHDLSFGTSERARELDRTLDLVAGQLGISILLIGESGTGKEVVAREVHRRSPLRDGPFVALDCGAVPEQLMESQLFGHKKGAFTGADRDQPGLFRMADGGTLFLDELGNLPSNLQPKLLRALQERAVVPVGGGDPVPYKARLIAATNANLQESVARGEFRLDLLHRINEFTVHLPPLRERVADVEYFAGVFLQEANRDMGRGVASITRAGLDALRAWRWPGNLRELRNSIRRAMVVCSGRELDAGDLSLGSLGPVRALDPALPADLGGLPLKERMRRSADALEAQIIQQALDEADGNKAAAARALQIDYTTMHRKLKRHGLLR